MKFDDRPEPAQRLEKARIARGFRTSKEAATYFGWIYDTYAQHENGTRGIVRAASKYAQAFHVSEGWLLTGEGAGPQSDDGDQPPGTVRKMGRVGAGAIVEAIDHGATEFVEAPADAKPNTVAVEVTGDSMFPAYEDGTLLYYSRLLPPAELINRRCVVQLADQRIFVKVLRKGSDDGVWTLQSLNPLVADIADVAVDWAAPIDWIKPR